MSMIFAAPAGAVRSRRSLSSRCRSVLLVLVLAVAIVNKAAAMR